MNKKYSIGFFAATFLAVAGMSTAYQLNYNQVKQELLAEQQSNKEMQEETQKKAVATEGTAKKENAYHLSELNGFVVVYLSDKTTIYEYTNIAISNLSEELQNEIREGKTIATTRELYGFLENYSS